MVIILVAQRTRKKANTTLQYARTQLLANYLVVFITFILLLIVVIVIIGGECRQEANEPHNWLTAAVIVSRRTHRCRYIRRVHFKNEE